MKMVLYFATAAALVLTTSTSTIAATKAKCTGEIYATKPPIPNNPTHIRNVVWRNADFLRQACQQLTIRQTERPAKDSPVPRS